MINLVRQTAMAAGVLALSLASTASWAVSFEFKTYFDTTTSDPLDTKSLSYSVATLDIVNIAGGGGVELTLKQLANPFPAKSGGTFIDALWLAGPNGALKLDSKDQSLAFNLFGGPYNSRSFTKDGYTYQWNVDFGGNSFSEGETAKLTIKGAGVSVDMFGSTPMLDLDNVGKPFATGFLGLNDNVHFLGSVVGGTPAIPEPGTYALLGLGLVGMAFVARRREA